MAKKKYRNFPRHSLEDALAIPRKIQDENAGKPFKRLLLAEALNIKPSSSNFRDLLSSSYKYGLTEGTEKASHISLTSIGSDATQTSNPANRFSARRKAALTPEIFGRFYKDYADRKLPSADMFPKLLVAEYGVPEDYGAEAADIIAENGRFVGIIKEIGGSPHVLLDAELASPVDDTDKQTEEPKTELGREPTTEEQIEPEEEGKEPPAEEIVRELEKPRPIFLGHGKKKEAVKQIEEILQAFQIPFLRAESEPHLARPIPKKVRDIMQTCGSAILIFTRDDKYCTEDGEEIWRPSENVAHELGAASFAYEDRIVIFKEKGLSLASNFSSIGYIEFEEGSIDAKAMDLLKELVGFGLVKVTPA